MNRFVLPIHIGRAALLLSAAAMPAPVLGALTWNAAGPSDNWNTTDTNWLPGNVAWTQNEDALFSGTAETVTVATPVTFNSLTFGATGFIIANGAGELTLANDLASTITVTNASDTATVAESLANNGTTASSLTKAGAGTLVLGGTTASTYTGQTLINEGILKTASAGSLGSGGTGAETIVASGATLDVNGQALTNTEVVRITGTGVGGSGALINTGASQTNALNRVELTGDATVGGTARFDIRTGTSPTLDLAGNTLTKTGTNSFHVVGGTVTNGNIVIDQGTFAIETTSVAQGTGTITINSTGILGLYQNTAGNFTRPITSNNGTITNLGLGGTVDSPISIAGGTTMVTVAANTQTFAGSITGTGPLNFTGPGAFTLTGTNTHTGGTTITDARLNANANANAVGAGPVTVNGDGVVSDGQFHAVGTVTFPNQFTISGRGGNSIDTAQRGALRLDSGATISGDITLAADAAIGSNAGIGTVTGDISGSFNLIKADGGTIALTGVNSYTGTTTISGGLLSLNYDTEDSSKLSDSAALVFGGGNLEIIGGTHEEVVASTTLNASTSSLITPGPGSCTINLGPITRNPKALLSIPLAGIAKTSSGTEGEAFGSWLTVEGRLATKDASSFLVPVTPEDYSTLTGPAIGDGAGHVNLIDAAGTVTLGGEPGDIIDVKTITRAVGGSAIIDTTDRTLRVGTPGTIFSATGSGGLEIGTANNAGFLTAGGPADDTPGTIDLRQAAGTVRLRSTVSDNGTGAVTLATRGTVWVTGTNTYTGGTIIEGFYHGISSDAALGAVPESFDPDNVILDGGTLSCYAGGYASVALNANRGFTLTANGGTFDAGGNQTLAINGIITGPGNIGTNTGGITALNALNTYTGTTTLGGSTTISANTLKDVGDITGSSLGNPATAAVGTIQFGTNSRLLYTGTGSTTNRVLNLSSSTASSTATVDHSGTGVLRFTSAPTATGASVKSLVLQGSTAGTGEIAGVIPNNSATNTTALVKAGTGTWTLQGTNTYTGGTTVNGGVLELAGSSANAAGKIRGTATVNAGGTLRLSVGDATGYGTGADRLSVINLTGGTLHVNSTSNQTLGSAVINMTGGAITGIAGSNLDFFAGASALNTLASPTVSTISGTSIAPVRQGNTTFTVADGTTPSGIDLSISSVLRTSPSGDPANATLIKAGTGTMELTGANTFGGNGRGIRVDAGVLLINNTTGSGAGTALVTVNSGALLGGGGSFTGALTVNSGAFLAPGNSAGTLATGAAVIDGTYACEINGATADKLAVTGNLDIDGATLNVSVLFGGATQPEYVIATYTGTRTGTFNGLPEGATVITGYTISYATAGQIKLVSTGPNYNSWASTFSPNPGAAGVDYESDGFLNGTEFILGGSPVSGSNNPKIHSFIADSGDEGTEKEFIVTIAVPVGTTAFTTGAPSTASFGGFGIAVRGSTTLDGFPIGITPVVPAITTGLPTAPFVQGGVSYEYRSFSLDGSNGMPGKGFVRVEVTNP